MRTLAGVTKAVMKVLAAQSSCQGPRFDAERRRQKPCGHAILAVAACRVRRSL